MMDIALISNLLRRFQCRFVEAVLNKEITIEGKSRTDIESTLRQRHFEPNPLKAPNHEVFFLNTGFWRLKDGIIVLNF